MKSTFLFLNSPYKQQHFQSMLLLLIFLSLTLGSLTEQKLPEGEPDLLAIDPEIYYSEEIEYAQLHDPKKRLLQNLVFSTEGLEEGRWILYAMGNYLKNFIAKKSDK